MEVYLATLPFEGSNFNHGPQPHTCWGHEPLRVWKSARKKTKRGALELDEEVSEEVDGSVGRIGFSKSQHSGGGMWELMGSIQRDWKHDRTFKIQKIQELLAINIFLRLMETQEIFETKEILHV